MLTVLRVIKTSMLASRSTTIEGHYRDVDPPEIPVCLPWIKCQRALHQFVFGVCYWAVLQGQDEQHGGSRDSENRSVSTLGHFKNVLPVSSPTLQLEVQKGVSDEDDDNDEMITLMIIMILVLMIMRMILACTIMIMTMYHHFWLLTVSRVLWSKCLTQK